MNECLAVFPQEFKLQSYVIIARANSSVIQPADPGSRFQHGVENSHISSCRKGAQKTATRVFSAGFWFLCPCSTFTQLQARRESSKSCHGKQITRLKLLSKTEGKAQGGMACGRIGGRELKIKTRKARKNGKAGKKERS